MGNIVVLLLEMLLLLLFSIIYGANPQLHGPVFLMEPPSKLTFSNTTGSQVSCAAHGLTAPKVEWIMQNGKTVAAVPGLRQSLGNGTLYFPPFRAEDYRTDVHSAIYRCRASNIAGTILSREVHVHAVLSEQYEVNVYHNHIIAGNTAILSCVIPSNVKKYVTVTSWIRDENILLPGTNLGGRMIVTYGSGDLLIRSARYEDSLSIYSCLTIHSLTQERKRSQSTRLTVIDSTKFVPPRFSSTILTSIEAYQETDIHLTCTAQGYPVPSFAWFQDIKGQLQPIQFSSRLEPSQDVLLIKRIRPEDAGRWICKVFNTLEEKRLNIQVNVIGHLNVQIFPQLQMINSGNNAIFNCTVSGTPINNVQWLKNGELIRFSDNGKIKFLDPLVLEIFQITRHDRGMYQCIVENERENAQGYAELRLGDTFPELQYTFIEQAVQPGAKVSLRCSSTGSPPPQFKWLIDGQSIIDLKPDNRYAISQYMDYAGDVIAYLNISNVRVEDGGLYMCFARNTLGKVEHSARLNVYGAPFIRSTGPAKAVAGTDAIVHCPYSGYPIKSVRWERHGLKLPQDMRHRVSEGGALTILKVDQNTDKGFYTCYVQSNEGHIARKEIQLVVNAPPVLEPFNFPSSIQEGERAQITCTVTSGDLPIKFTWYKNQGFLHPELQVEERSAEFFSMLVFKNVNSKHSGAYTCVASNAAALVNYTAQLMVKVAPQWIVEPQNVSTLLGNSVLIQCSAKGFPEPIINWLKGILSKSTEYKAISGLQGVNQLENGSLWFVAVKSLDEGSYLCRASNGIGNGIGKVIYVAVKEPVRFDIPFRNISVKREKSITLLCHVHGDVPIEIHWLFNGAPLDLQELRFSHVNLKDEKDVKSQLTISRTDRKDSGTYKCLAENDFGRSEHVINLSIQEKPDPPSHLEAIEVLGRSLNLSWKKSFDGNSALMGYIIQYKILDSFHSTWENSNILNLNMSTIIHLRGDIEQGTIRGLKPSTVYTIRISAQNNIDKSEFTEAIIVKTLEECPSGTPLNVKIDAMSSTELFIQWSPPLRNSWNGDLLGYKINWKEHHDSNNNNNNNNLTNVDTVNGWATNKYLLRKLKKFTTYDIVIKAFNHIGIGPPSPVLTGTTKEGTPEAPPRNISCSEISSQIIKISWQVPSLNTHGGLIQGYKIFYKPIENQFIRSIDTNLVGEVKRTQSTETYLHGLLKFTNYSIRVLAYTSAGDGVISDHLYCPTEEDVPDKPANIKAIPLTAESILISWLPPKKRNGILIFYTVYSREAGRVGFHKSYNVKIDNRSEEFGLIFEIRHLKEHQLYEFWVSATTKIGEGDSTRIVPQQTHSRAPSKIASFSQFLYKPNKSGVVLPCIAVGNPKPRTRWIHQGKPITFNTFYAVTLDGHLNIHNVDVSLTGNYTCEAVNLFGEDTITYSLIVLTPPLAPELQIEYTTGNSVKIKWTEPDNGGTRIQGYTLNLKDEKSDWQIKEIPIEPLQYTIEDLKCGTRYYIYLCAENKVGRGIQSPIISILTKGGPPHLPKQNEIFEKNSTAICIDLKKWPNGGCVITQFSIEYKPYTDSKWIFIAKSVTTERIIIQNLMPGIWYQIKVIAENDAGLVRGFFNIATLTIQGNEVPMLPKLLEEIQTSEPNDFWTGTILVIPISTLLILFLVVGLCIMLFYKKRTNVQEMCPQNGEVEQYTVHHGQYRNDEPHEKENPLNLQQMYLTSPTKSCKNLPRSDFTMQLKTFNHNDNTGRPKLSIAPNKRCDKELIGDWQNSKTYCNNEIAASRTSHLFYHSERLNHDDSDSEDTSGSGQCPTTSAVPNAMSFRPLKKVDRKLDERYTGITSYTDYETLLVADLFRKKDSSTESNDVSPLAKRRSVTPKSYYRTTPSSSR